MSVTFTQYFDGSFQGILRWHQLDALWEKVRAQPEGWYASLVGEALPDAPLSAEALEQFIREMDTLLREEHDYDYCGVVYADNPATPTMIKIYDPHNMGSACGSSGERIWPRWVLSHLKPEPLAETAPLPGNRKRWWQKLFN
ncbi:hypothetical protein [Thiothrix subterranea]|uniref:Uncharacterized protein n=1 Tax=Thiothrix subterranea TaxID=2735563 RepID=A0AA51MQR7_9GAMM|nr:hypothetical protein [Thiothrix subterranea]MDQ5767484.1 hypothetical protein [Thiothrix subterranea]WML88645.1 hypothetical protein RCG00_09750 [Thiothrix subterranea]